MDAEFITIHNTYNNASANNEVNYMINNNNSTSFHFAIDNKEVVQAIPLNRNAWASGDGSKGDGNRKSIHIEICHSKSGGELYKKAEQLSIKFIAQLLHERGWGIDRVKSHKYWTEVGVNKGYSTYVKNCPHRILDEGRWQSVLNEIEKELKFLNGSISIAKGENQKLEEVMGMKMSDFITNGDMIRLETVYRYARVDGFLSDDAWEKKCADKTITVGEVCYLNALLDHRRHGVHKNQIDELTAEINQLKGE